MKAKRREFFLSDSLKSSIIGILIMKLTAIKIMKISLSKVRNMRSSGTIEVIGILLIQLIC